ncbi:MAG: HAD family hydrolase [Sphingomonadaceae bacterium]
MSATKGAGLAVYDMDRTVTRRASWTAWLFFFARTEAPARLLLAPLLVVPLIGFALRLYGRKGLKERTQRLMLGDRVPRPTVERAAEAFVERFAAAHERADALAAIRADRAAGRRLVLATASPRYYAEAFARRWGFDDVVATRNRWEGDHLTPRIDGENCYSMGKLRMLVASIGGRPGPIRFASDHESDLPALLWADEAVAVSPSATLRRMAAARGWRILDWT